MKTEELLTSILEQVNWDYVISSPSDNKVGESFVEAVCEAALEANTPMYHSAGNRQQRKHQQQVDTMNGRKLKLIRLNQAETITNTQKEQNVEEIRQINIAMEETLKKRRVEEEKTAISRIKNDSAFFFRYANKHRKSKERIGPLRSKTTYETGPLKMAEILSKQYQSAFSTPRDNKINFPLRVTENFLTDFKITESAMESAMKRATTPST